MATKVKTFRLEDRDIDRLAELRAAHGFISDGEVVRFGVAVLQHLLESEGWRRRGTDMLVRSLDEAGKPVPSGQGVSMEFLNLDEGLMRPGGSVSWGE